jgi:ubiquinone/menaquinone biosynthesis C-methylase UbiE
MTFSRGTRAAFRRAMLAVLLAGVASPPIAIAERAGASPEINEPYRDPDFDQWVSRFEQPGREVYDRREAILREIELRSGMAVADIGAGTGLFTRLFATRVGAAGRVYAVDVSRSFVDNILRRTKGEGLQNVVGVVNTQDDVRLPPDSIDLAFICDTYHHFERPQPTLRSIRKALRPGGKLVVIDYQRIQGESSDWILGHVRAGKDTAIREIERAGFRLDRDVNLLRENYFLRFSRGG